MPPNYLMLFPLEVRVYILFSWTQMISSNKRILKWCYLTSKAGPSKSIPLLFRSFEMLPLLMFPFGTLLRNQLPYCGMPKPHGEDICLYFGQQFHQGSILFSPGSRMRVKKHPDASKMKPQTWWSREKTSLLFPGQNLDLPTCEHNKILFVLHHLPRAALLNSHK